MATEESHRGVGVCSTKSIHPPETRPRYDNSRYSKNLIWRSSQATFWAAGAGLPEHVQSSHLYTSPSFAPPASQRVFRSKGNAQYFFVSLVGGCACRHVALVLGGATAKSGARKFACCEGRELPHCRLEAAILGLLCLMRAAGRLHAALNTSVKTSTQELPPADMSRAENETASMYLNNIDAFCNIPERHGAVMVRSLHRQLSVGNVPERASAGNATPKTE